MKFAKISLVFFIFLKKVSKDDIVLTFPKENQNLLHMQEL